MGILQDLLAIAIYTKMTLKNDVILQLLDATK